MASATWKRDFASGLIILLPVLVTAFIIVWLYNKIKQVPIPVTDPTLRVVLTLLIFILMVFSMGYLMRTAFGNVIEGAIDDAMNQLPGLRVVYNASKMAVETAVSGTDDLQAPVKLETWDGLRMTAFKTGKTTDDSRDVLFLPTAPNITTGFVIEVDPEKYEETDESVEDALTRILSAGFGDADERAVPVGMEEGLTDDATAEDADGAIEAETGVKEREGQSG